LFDTLQFQITPSTTYFNSTNPISLNNRFGINSPTSFSWLSTVSTTATGIGTNMFNFVDGRFNKNRTTYNQSVDTSSFNFSFTPLGKPLFSIKNQIGTNVLTIDSTAGVTGITTLTASSFTGNLANSVTNADTIFVATLVSDNVITKTFSVTLVDDGTYNFPTTKTVSFDIFVNGGDERAIGTITTLGVPIIGISFGTTLWDIADTDGKYDIYDGGAFGVLKNRSGSQKTFFITIRYNRI
jgi:hypothetical protein